MWNTLQLLHTQELAASNIVIAGEPARIVKIPIVGTKHIGVEPYSLTKGVTLVREPTNPFDVHAIKVVHNGVDIGYIPRDKQHYFNRDFEQSSSWQFIPKAIATSTSWAIFVIESR